VEEYRRAGALDPVRQQRYAHALADLGRLEEAGSVMAVISEADTSADGWMVRGLVGLANGRMEDAVQAFTRGDALGVDPALAVNHCAVLLAVQRPDARVCSEALMKSPENPRALLGLAAASTAGADRVVARRALNDLQSARGVTTDQWMEAARLYRILGDDREACALRLRTGTPVGREDVLETGRSCAAAGRWDDARSLLEPLSPATPEAAFILGTMALERALDADEPSEREGWIGVGRTWMASCAEADRDNAAWFNNMGRLEDLDGEQEKAEEDFRKALSLDPGLYDARLNLARLLHRLGRVDAACAEMSSLWTSDSDYRLVAGVDLAVWSRERGDAGLARRIGEAVLTECVDAAVKPCVAEAGLFLAVLETEEGNVDQALERLEQAVTASPEVVRSQARVEPEFEALADNLRFAQILDPTIGASP